MQRLFRIETDSNQGIVSVAQWDWLRQGLLRNLDTVTSYYRSFPSRIDGSHFLIRLIFSMAISKNLDLDRAYAIASSRGLTIGTANRMTSSMSKGMLFDGVFYGPGCKEILIAHDEPFDYRRIRDNWRALRPITVLQHPKSDLNMNVPDGSATSDETGLAVIAINVPMLAMQFREFKIYEDALSEVTGNNPRGVTHFIHSYPLTNMLYSHLDIAVFNRLHHLSRGIPLGVASKKHSFFLTDFSNKLKEVQLKQLSILLNAPKRFDTMLRMIPLVTSKNLWDLARLPKTADTRQVVWALATGRIDLLSFMFTAAPNPRIQNAREVNNINRMLKLFHVDQVLSSMLPIDLYFSVQRELARIETA